MSRRGVSAVFSIWIAVAVVLLVISFIATQLGIQSIPRVGYLILLVIGASIIALVISGVRDFKVDKSEIIYFILVVGTLFAIFFIFKHYIPSLFSALPNNLEESLNNLFSFIK